MDTTSEDLMSEENHAQHSQGRLIAGGGLGSRVGSVLRRAVMALCWVAVAVAGALWVGRQVGVTSEWGVTALAITPYSVVAAAVAVLVLIAGGARRSAVPAVILLAVTASVQIGLYIPAHRVAEAPLATVMTANLLHGLADPDALLSTVDDHGVGVLAVQELTPEAVATLTASGIDRPLPYHVLVPGALGAGVGIWSRYPLTQPSTLTGFGFAPVRATLNIGDRSVTVVSFHSKAPLYNGGTEQWAADLDRLAELVPTLPTPAVIAGDFNATRDHRQFRDLLAGGYTDAASDAGAGILPTFPADVPVGPVAGIDHVLVSGDLLGVDAQSMTQPGSDHRAVIASIAVAADPAQ